MDSQRNDDLCSFLSFPLKKLHKEVRVRMSYARAAHRERIYNQSLLI